MAAPDRTVTATPTAPAEWTGATANGANTNYDSASGAPCTKTPDEYCDITLVHVDVPASYWSGRSGGVEFRTFDYVPLPSSDFDLYVYESNAAGRRGRLVGSSGAVPGEEERTTVSRASGYYLVQVVYFAVLASNYKGSAKFVHRDSLPDVDDPPGLQEFLASDPAHGIRSHSEPHLAQNPLDPDVLVAGSKMYDTDVDSLVEYEFKIGTYASFDGGVIWSDLGQLAVCSAAEAPRSSFPNNTCYPENDPARGGTGDEDVDDPDDPEDPFDPRGSGDYGEEYTTSDVWIHFDDEGNAYTMVLDHPSFESGTPNGWGMTLHRWESVSADDIRTGNTWSGRIPINKYDDGFLQEFALDDKNTFAVNNAGPDRDGRTGIIVTCWGQNLPDVLKQQQVCKRSTDGGRTFPGEPVPISGAEQLNIGVHVVADTKDENTFYATWLQYATSIVGAPDSIQFTKTTDGGQTWSPPQPIATLTSIPRTFPGQSFRNLSLPIMAVGPNGEVYVTYAEYRDAPQDEPPEEDDMQADIMLLKSTDGGSSFSDPKVVNGDRSNADQFQQYVAVNPDGQVNVAFFDRRHDPSNFYIDTYLARSDDGADTFTETRISHELSDPSINPPISPSGDFFGDYQGLVADECFTIPFFQDTHLANPQRDASFDEGMPRSQYQEVFAWRVLNQRNFDNRRCTTPPPGGGEGAPPPTTPEGLPVVRLIAPRLASDRSTSSRFPIRVLAGAPAIDHYVLQYRLAGTSAWRTLDSNLIAATKRFRGRYGATYEFRAQAVDRRGRAGPFESAATIIPLDDRARTRSIRYRGRWRQVKARNSFRRGFSRSTRRGSRVRFRFRGSRFYLVGRKSQYGGRALVIVNGRRRTVNFYGARARNRQLIKSFATGRRGTSVVEIVVLGKRGHRSARSARVEVDALGFGR